jgi:hypothetical protein
MRSLRAVALVGTVLAIALIGAPTASAATEVGNNCTGANVTEANFTVVQLAQSSSDPLPLTAPAAGVVTKWKSTSAFGTSFLDRLVVLRAASLANSFLTVGESAYENIAHGQNTFDTRMTVQAGDRFGLSASYPNGASLFCNTSDPADHMGAFHGNTGGGAPTEFTEIPGAAVAVSAVIEPDKDGDGYGDETQDGCPQSAAYHGPCPTIALDTFPVVLKHSILVLVSASETSSVQVYGQVGWKPRHKGGALASKTPDKPGDHLSTGAIVGLSGGTTLVKTGEVTPYNVQLPKSVIRHLSDISPKQVVKGTITARTTDLAGRVTEHTITIRLHGRKARAS